jgi:hypothetical protein
MLNAMDSLTDHDIQRMRAKTDGLVDEVQVGDTYALKTDVFLLRVNIGDEELLALGVPAGLKVDARRFSVPDSTEQYHANPTHWPEVVRVLSEGTRVRVSQINEERELGSGYGYGALPGHGLSTLGSVVLDDTLHCVICPEEGTPVVIADPWILEGVELVRS